jgi:hypothetical protein
MSAILVLRSPILSVVGRVTVSPYSALSKVRPNLSYEPASRHSLDWRYISTLFKSRSHLTST